VTPGGQLQTAPERVVGSSELPETFINARSRRQFVGAHLSKDAAGHLVRHGVEVE
jgi:hypothetical protein